MIMSSADLLFNPEGRKRALLKLRRARLVLRVLAILTLLYFFWSLTFRISDIERLLSMTILLSIEFAALVWTDMMANLIAIVDAIQTNNFNLMATGRSE